MKIFGILNATPDSFSDSSQGLTSEAIARKGYEMMQDGAAFIDIGAESTRPDATPLTHAEEWSRLEPVLIIGKNLPTSIDTYHPETAAKALQFSQVEYINDVSGLRDDKMAKVIADNNAKIIIMHSLTVPADKEVTIQGNPVTEILNWIDELSLRLKNFKIPAENVILDIGLGFGKTAEQSIQLLQNIDELTKKAHSKGMKMLVGHSRKSFLSKFTDKSAKDRDFETAIVTNYLASQGVDYIRVHNVALNNQAIAIGESLFLEKN